MGTTDPLAFPAATYVAVLTVAVVGGLVGYLNKGNNPKLWEAGIAALTSAFLGFIAFCICVAKQVEMSWTLVYVGLIGVMGRRAFTELLNSARARLGLPPAPNLDNAEPDSGEGNK